MPQGSSLERNQVRELSCLSLWERKKIGHLEDEKSIPKDQILLASEVLVPPGVIEEERIGRERGCRILLTWVLVWHSGSWMKAEIGVTSLLII